MTAEDESFIPAAVQLRPYWQAEPCPAWCDNPHDDHDFIGDRRHMSGWSGHIVLTTEEPTIFDWKPDDRDGPWSAPFELAVWLDQHVRDAAPLVILHERHRRIDELHLTPAEARQLAEALIQGADLATGNTEQPAADATVLSLPAA